MAEQEPIKKKVHGCAKLNFLKTKQLGKRFEMDMIVGMQPIGRHSIQSRFIRAMAMDGNRFPLNESCFSEFKKKPIIQEVIAEVKDIFEFSSFHSNSKDVDDWITYKLVELWKANKAKVKEDNFTAYATHDVDQNLQISPPPEIEENV